MSSLPPWLPEEGLLAEVIAVLLVRQNLNEAWAAMRSSRLKVHHRASAAEPTSIRMVCAQ
jgi:hypothetical protein